jgi:hypothetical protein
VLRRVDAVLEHVTNTDEADDFTCHHNWQMSDAPVRSR